MKKNDKKETTKATWIQLSKDKKKGIVYEVGMPEDYPPSQQPYPWRSGPESPAVIEKARRPILRGPIAL